MTAPAAADPVADFYKGKTISVIVGAGPAGGYDLSARLVARHLPRFVSGNPNVVVRNMPGASSNLAALHVFNVAARDGSVLGMFQPTFVIEKINDHSLKYEPDQFTWISRVDTSTLVGIVWHKSPVQTIADAKQKQAVLAGIAASGTAATVPWALNQIIGTKFKVALGYSSSATSAASASIRKPARSSISPAQRNGGSSRSHWRKPTARCRSLPVRLLILQTK